MLIFRSKICFFKVNILVFEAEIGQKFSKWRSKFVQNVDNKVKFSVLESKFDTNVVIKGQILVFEGQ